MLALEPTEFLKPSSRVLYLSAVAATLQVPGMLARVLASGPIKAILPLRCKGSRLSWFFSSTNVSVAIWRAMERCSGVNTSFSARFTSQYLYGLANNPSLYLASRMRRQALSMSASVTLPFFQCADKSVGYHVHVCSGGQGTCGYFLQVADSVVYHFGDGCIVCHHEAVEAPLVA